MKRKRRNPPDDLREVPHRPVATSDSSDFTLEPFGVVLAAGKAGSHDGQHLAVSLEYLTDPVVAYHERVHECIFVSTPDGQVLSALLQLRENAKRGGRALPPAVALLTKRLSDNSRLAHEAAATYLAIKRFSPGPGDSTYKRLPAKYHGYYHTLADVIDARFEGNRLQRLLAEGIWMIAFQSLYQARLADAGLDRPPDPRPEELPDERLGRLVDALPRSDMGELGRKLKEAIEMLTNTFASERRKHGIDENAEMVSTQFDKILSRNYLPMVCEHLIALSSLPSLSKEANHTTVLRKFAKAVRPFGLTIMPGNKEALAGVEAKLAFWQADSLLINPRLVPLEQGDDRLLAGDELFTSLEAFQVLSAEPPENLSQWMFVGFPHSSVAGLSIPWGARFSAAAVLDWLGRCRDREKDRQPCPLARSIAIAVSEINDIEQFQQTLMGQISIVEDAGRMRGHSFAAAGWYWRGNWIRLLWELTKRGRLQGHTVALTKSQQLKLGEGEQVVVLKVLQSPTVMGRIFRVLSARAAEEIRPQESRLYRTGKFTRMQGHRAEAASYAARNAFQLIQDRWSRF